MVVCFLLSLLFQDFRCRTLSTMERLATIPGMYAVLHLDEEPKTRECARGSDSFPFCQFGCHCGYQSRHPTEENRCQPHDYWYESFLLALSSFSLMHCGVQSACVMCHGFAAHCSLVLMGAGGDTLFFEDFSLKRILDFFGNLKAGYNVVTW